MNKKLDIFLGMTFTPEDIEDLVVFCYIRLKQGEKMSKNTVVYLRKIIDLMENQTAP